MENKQQSETLIFANDRPSSIGDDLYKWASDAEDMIRRLHTESEQHLQELAAYRFTVENLRARVAELEAQLVESTHHTQQGLAQDAERYRMMRDRAEFLDNAKHCIFERDGWEIHGLLQGNDLDVVIDAAIAAQAKQGGVA